MYSCHMVAFGQRRMEGSWNDHMRFRKVLKQDELCPLCEEKLEEEMCRNLRWLRRRDDFKIEVVYIIRGDGSEEQSLASPSTLASLEGFEDEWANAQAGLSTIEEEPETLAAPTAESPGESARVGPTEDDKVPGEGGRAGNAPLEDGPDAKPAGAEAEKGCPVM